MNQISFYDSDDDEDILYVPLSKRKQRCEKGNDEIFQKNDPINDKNSVYGPESDVTLFKRLHELRKTQPKKSLYEIEKEKEEKLLNNVSVRKALIPVANVDNKMDKRKICWGWKYPDELLKLISKKQVDMVYRLYRISIQSDNIVNCPYPILSFRDMCLPKRIISYLEYNNIIIPTPIQMQGIPVILSGRDMIGISYTGSGKTLAFTIPMIVISLIQEIRLNVVSGEGPFCLVLCPNRELAQQIYNEVDIMTRMFNNIRCFLCMGGTNTDFNRSVMKGFHICIATPGRLIHMLESHVFTLNYCKYLVLDEADRLVDLGFEKDMRTIFDFFKCQKQTVLFSATMPPKIQLFARSALREDAIIINVGRPGASSMNVKQEFVYIEESENRMVELLNCIQKTGPPVLIFSSDKNDVDDIYEYLLHKGINACSLHGSKEQIERNYAINSFKENKKDVLVATGIASKGLDFKDIQHVINFDMPNQIEDYVHRIGRTGRWGKPQGLATTLISFNQCELNILLDLKNLLQEAKQKIPPFLEQLKEFEEKNSYNRNKSQFKKSRNKGCSYCGGLGHTITNCTKLVRDTQKNRQYIQEEKEGAY